MKNAEILRMAEALLTPAVQTSSSSSSSSADSSDSGTVEGDNTIDQLSLVSVTSSIDGATGTAASTTVVTVAVDDPRIKERLRILLETTVRLLYPKGLLAGAALPTPAYPLVGEGEFPLPDGLAAAAAYHTAWLLTGETRLAAAFDEAMEIYYASLEACVAPIVRKH
ncbi:MAG: hypothetical protein IJX47_05435 [Clostridia bacterium]|nr:hypothetical protein [Clostridia bacterium]